MIRLELVWLGLLSQAGSYRDDCQGTACFGGNGMMCNGGARGTGAPGCGRIHAGNRRGRGWWHCSH